MSKITWKKAECAVVLRDGTQRKYSCYSMKDGPLAVAKIGNKNWSIIVTAVGRNYLQRFTSKTDAQKAAVALVEQGGFNFNFPYAEQIVADAGGYQTFRDATEVLIGASY